MQQASSAAACKSPQDTEACFICRQTDSQSQERRHTHTQLAWQRLSNGTLDVHKLARQAAHAGVSLLMPQGPSEGTSIYNKGGATGLCHNLHKVVTRLRAAEASELKEASSPPGGKHQQPLCEQLSGLSIFPENIFRSNKCKARGIELCVPACVARAAATS